VSPAVDRGRRAGRRPEAMERVRPGRPARVEWPVLLLVGDRTSRAVRPRDDRGRQRRSLEAVRRRSRPQGRDNPPALAPRRRPEAGPGRPAAAAGRPGRPEALRRRCRTGPPGRGCWDVRERSTPDLFPFVRPWLPAKSGWRLRRPRGSENGSIVNQMGVQVNWNKRSGVHVLEDMRRLSGVR